MKKLSSIFIIVILIFVCFLLFACKPTSGPMGFRTVKRRYRKETFIFNLEKTEYNSDEDVVLEIFLGTEASFTPNAAKFSYVIIEGDKLQGRNSIKNSEEKRTVANIVENFNIYNYPLDKVEENSIEIVFPANVFIGDEGVVYLRVETQLYGSGGVYNNRISYKNLSKKRVFSLSAKKIGYDY